MEHTNTAQYRSYQGGYFKTLIAPEQANNALALLEFTLPKGAEPPPHTHTNEDETFYVLEGSISVTIADNTTILEPGEAVFAPRNIPHSFQILTEKATLINLISPGSLWNFFIQFSAPVSGQPAISTTPNPPPPDKIKQMQDVISNEYKVIFA